VFFGLSSMVQFTGDAITWAVCSAISASRVERLWHSYIRSPLKQRLKKLYGDGRRFALGSHSRYSGRGLADHASEDATRYLESPDRRGDLEDGIRLKLSVLYGICLG
jgi:hypothetical protein